MKYEKLFKQILSEITPSKEEREKTLSKVKQFLTELNFEFKKRKIKAKAVLGGSYAKDVWLAGDYDVDIFVKFKPTKDSLSDLLEKALKQWKPERIHGSRDYFWVRDQIKYEIIPVLDIKNPKQAQNVTDFSPHHVAWVNKKGKKFKNEIRLAKKFCKSANCYGAESYIRGFSGHVLDILVIYYKGFINLLKSAAKWKPKTEVDYNNTYKGRAIMHLNKSKTEGPLILIDPVQPQRNAAAALVQENFDKFINAAKKFLNNPQRKYFEEKEINFEKLQKQGRLLKIEVKTQDDKEDVAGTKLVRAFEFLREKLYEFEIKKSGWQWDKKSKGTWWYVIKKDILAPYKDWPGPPLKFKEAVNKFKKIHKRTFIKKGKIWSKVKQEKRTIKEFAEELIRQEFVKSRVKSAKVA